MLVHQINAAILLGIISSNLYLCTFSVTLRHASECTKDLPIFHKNQAWYRCPHSHVLKPTSNTILCDLEGNVFDIGGRLFRQTPSFVPFTPAVKQIKPNQQSFRDVFSTLPYRLGSIYSSTVLQNTLRAILIPMDRVAAKEDLATSMILANSDGSSSIKFGTLGDPTKRFLNTLKGAFKKFQSQFMYYLSFTLTMIAIGWCALILLLWLLGIFKNIAIHGFRSFQAKKSFLG